MNAAVKEDLLLSVMRQPGHFVGVGSPLLRVWPAGRMTEQMSELLKSAFVLGNRRTDFQDIEYVVGQLGEVAVRALSPGINDPFTAISCIDRLGSALRSLAQRELPSPYRRDKHGKLRVIVAVITFPNVLDTAFDPIRRYGRTSAEVTMRLLETIGAIAPSVRRAEDRAALRRHAANIACDARAALPNRADRRKLKQGFDRTRRELGAGGY